MKEVVRSEMAYPAQLQATSNVVPPYTWYATPSGGLTFVNRRTADYLGLPEDMARSLSLAPLASFACWRGRSTAGPSH